MVPSVTSNTIQINTLMVLNLMRQFSRKKSVFLNETKNKLYRVLWFRTDCPLLVSKSLWWHQIDMKCDFWHKPSQWRWAFIRYGRQLGFLRRKVLILALRASLMEPNGASGGSQWRKKTVLCFCEAPEIILRNVTWHSIHSCLGKLFLQVEPTHQHPH